VYVFTAGKNLPASTAVGGSLISGVCYGNDNTPLAVTDSETCLSVLGGNAWSPAAALHGTDEPSSGTPADTTVVYSCEQNGQRNLITTKEEVINCSGNDFLACEYVNRAGYDRNEATYCSDRVRQWHKKFGDI